MPGSPCSNTYPAWAGHGVLDVLDEDELEELLVDPYELDDEDWLSEELEQELLLL